MCAQIINKQTDKPLTLKTLRLAFKSQLSDGLVVANGLVSQALFKKALGKDPGAISAIIWWEKTRAGKRETLAPEQDISGTARQLCDALRAMESTNATAPA